MKILFMISTLTNGGAERAMSNITTHLPDGVEADILLNSVSEHDYPTKANIINLGMAPQIKKGLLYQFQASIKRMRMLRKLKRSNHYDACVSFMDSANVCNILTGNKYCKTIVSVRISVANDHTFKYRYIVSPLIKLLYNRADWVVPVSKGLQKELEEIYGIQKKRICTITNGFDAEQINRQALEVTQHNVEIPKGKYIYITTGRYTQQKAQWHLIRAFSQVAEKCENAMLLILGQGEEEEYLKKIIENYKMEKKILLIPFCTNPFPYLKCSKVFIMPSMYEGYCNALCEALICGLPCIATDFKTSAREILAPDTAITYQNKDHIEYAKYGILTPVCSGTKYMGKEKLEQGEEYLAQAMIKLYNDKELYDRYKVSAGERGNQMNIDMKVQEWISLINENMG